MAFVLAAMGEQLDAILDVTVVYPQQKIPGFWDLISGNVPRVIIDIKTRELDPALWQGDYENDPVFRENGPELGQPALDREGPAHRRIARRAPLNQLPVPAPQIPPRLCSSEPPTPC